MPRRKPPPQEIVRGPAVQGHGPQERRESPDAGKGAARTVAPVAKAVRRARPASGPADPAASRPGGSAPRRKG